MRHRSPAICLRTSDYSETSQVVSFLTRGQGIVRVIAKGVKRPKSKAGGALDLLAEGELVYTAGRGEGLGTLIEFAETAWRTALRRDAARLNAALYALELTGALLGEGDPMPEAFDLLHNALGRLGQPDAPAPAVLAYFQWRLLRRVGLLGDLHVCGACGRTTEAVGRGDVWWSAAAGGLLCDACEGAHPEKYRLDDAALAGLVALAEAERGRRVSLPPDQAHAANRALAYHAAWQVGQPLRMARHAIPAPRLQGNSGSV